jgi:anti-sigma factor RsiW
MNEAQFNHLRETNWQRQLNATEAAEVEGYLAANPAARADWEAELALNEQLGHLPPPPLASNFTAQVLGAVREEIAREEREAQRPVVRWGWG